MKRSTGLAVLLIAAAIVLAVAIGGLIAWQTTPHTLQPAGGTVDGVSASASSDHHFGRHGPLTEREHAMARAAWQYFVNATQEKTGLANSVGTYPSTTMWDTASYISGMVSAHELGLIDKREFDERLLRLLSTLRDLNLFRGEMPNKVYNTKTGEKVDYTNKPGEVGFSALDIGRMLIWLDIVKQRYPYLANSVDSVALKWKYCNVISADGRLYGAAVAKDGKTQYFQEGRLGYEEYAAKGFGLWGFATERASRAYPFKFIDIYGVQVPYDGRDPRVYKVMNYVVMESYLLDGIELGWDLPDDDYSTPDLFTDGWRAEFAQRVYLAQQRRFEQTGVLTARTEHQVDGKPFFVYDTVFADGYPWNTLSPSDTFEPDRAAVALKGALGMWALWDTPYTDQLFEAVADLYLPDKGFYEGLYENGRGVIPLQTANNNGIILAALLFKEQGPVLQRRNRNQSLWYTAFDDGGDMRSQRCLPAGPLQPRCQSATRCTQPEAETLHFEQYQYCEPVATQQWYPGCPSAHPEPAARHCDIGKLIERPVPSSAPGSQCKACCGAAVPGG